jgi:anthranilate/para-aminobenzoate synthase component II
VVGQLLIQFVEWLGHQGALLRTLGEQIVRTEETLHGNQEESRQKKETLSGPMLVKKFPKASQEKHLSRGFSVKAGELFPQIAATGQLFL